MRVETYRRRRFAIWFLWIVLAVAIMFGLWQLLSNLELSCSDIEAIVEEDVPPGTVAEINTNQPGIGDTGSGSGGTGSGPGFLGIGSGPGTGETGGGGDGSGPEEPNGGDTPPGPGGGGPSVTIETDSAEIYVTEQLDFGVLFPGEVVTKFITIEFQDAPSYFAYQITITDNLSGDYSMKPYLKVEKDNGEGENEFDDLVARGAKVPPENTEDLTATGYIDASDLSDKWWVTFYVPSERVPYDKPGHDVFAHIVIVELDS